MRRFKKTDRYAFLAADLEIIEKPPSPFGAAIIYIIVTCMITLLILSFLLKIDVLITTTGILEPQDGISIVNTNTSGRIKKIYKKEGDRVKKGEKILELENIYNEQIKNLEDDLKYRKLQKAMLESEVDKERNDEILQHEDLDMSDFRELSLEYEIYWSTREYEQSTYEERYQKLVKEIQSVKKDEERLSELQRQLKDLQVQREMETAKENLQLLQNVNAVKKQIKDDEGKLAQLKKERKNLIITSPIDGTMFNSYDYTVGMYTRAMEDIVKIVPEKSTYIVKTKVENQYISKLRIGQQVTIKLNAYDYQVYGGLKGQIKSISATSVLNELTNNLDYEVEIEITEINEKMELKSGMTATLDIKTKRERLIDYILSPIKKIAEDAF